MGLDRTVQFPAGGIPAWGVIKTQLARVGERGQLRMIDGLPAFPDEEPESGWRELRVAVGSGMVTVRRGDGVLTCVVWSNADTNLLGDRDRVVWACAVAGGGSVVTDTGTVSAAEFAQLSDIRPA